LINSPFCLSRRICTIVEDNSIKHEKLDELKNVLQKQKYQQSIIDNGIKKALDIPTTELRSSKTIASEKVIPFINTHNPNNLNIFPIIKQSFKNLQLSNNTKKAFSNVKLINSKRQAPNLERILCKSEFHTSEQTFTVKKCGKSCFCCNYVKESNTYIFRHNQIEFNVKNNFTCETSNLIYVIICNTCKNEYIGQTSRMLKERINIYRQHIRQPQYQMIKVEEHLRICGEGKFQVFPFFKLKSENKFLRDSYESHFIQKFKPTLNATDKS